MSSTKFTCDLSQEVWWQTYKYHTDETVDDTHQRIAEYLASLEKDPGAWTKRFRELLADFKFVPGGRINSNAGTGLKGTTLINCFVSHPDEGNVDSISGIFGALTKAALTLKSEGGYGFCCDFIRPRGAFINGVGVESPGSVEMLGLWDKMSEVITKGSGKKKKTKKGKNKIRKGAMMVTSSVWHPDILEFITAKQTPNTLTKFNMSVLVYDRFMKAVEEGADWDLVYPVTTHEKYTAEWDGNLDKWVAAGYPIEVYSTMKAADLWELITTSTYNRNEPGILFVDRINQLNNLYYCEHISATNPCGEQVLPKGGVCLLGSMNLTQFVNADRTGWDYEKIARYLPDFVRMLDNVNDLTQVPLEEQRWNLENKRRIGVGYLGYGSALYLLGVRYGSPRALQLTQELSQFVTNTVYKASSLLAKEKGSFPLFDCDKYLAGAFVKQALDADTIEMIRANGLRNSHLTSIQPTGNSSIYANNVSGGLEPVVSAEYVRTSSVPVPPDGMELPVIDWGNKSFTGGNLKWGWKKEGDENLLFTEFNGTVYKIDRNRGLTKETLIEDYAVSVLKAEGSWDPNAEYAGNLFNLTIKEHVDTMKVFARYIDSAMSKTINVPNDYPYEDFKTLYTDMYKSGVIKGGTSYRMGTMTSVISVEKTDKDTSVDGRPAEIVAVHAPKRPAELDAEIHSVTVAGNKWVVLVGLLGGAPYEIFAGRSNKLSIPSKFKNGKICKVKQGNYDLHIDAGDEPLVVKDIINTFDNAESAWATRMLSMSLRHGVEVAFVVEQLTKDGGINDVNKVLGRILKKYIPEGSKVKSNAKCPECGSSNLVYSEGCMSCRDCNFQKCG